MMEQMNPWWGGRGWEEVDFDLRRFSANRVKWIPNWINNISAEVFSLNFVFGPRQVGKTTGIKFWVKRLIDEGRDPKSIVYINCDLLASFRELRNVLERVTRYEFVILDEVTGLEYWWKALKGFVDMGVFERSVLVVSGSSSIKLWRFAESFAGRRGKGKDIVVLPLSFPEFAQVTGLEGMEAFSRYLDTGGFPRSVNSDPHFPADLLASLDREFARMGRSPQIGREIIYEVLRKTPSPLSYQCLAAPLGISHVTVREYLELMSGMFLLGLAYFKGERIDFKKEKKIFFRDPFLARTFSTISGIEVRKEAMYEWVVQEHLLRRFGEVYYWRNRYEIDCVAGNLKVEVKAGKPHRRYPSGVEVLELEDIPDFLLRLYRS